MPLFRLDSEEDSLNEIQSIEFMDNYAERDLQDWVEKNSEVIYEDEPVLIIGREVMTDTGHFIDLLGIDRNGYPVVIELKATKTPRTVISQTLDYASWVGTLSNEELMDIGEEYIKENSPYDSFREAFNDTFSGEDIDFLKKLIEENHINSKRRLVIIAEDADRRTERMVKELDANGSIVSLISYTYYMQADKEFLNFEPVFRSIPPKVEVGESIQTLRAKVLKEKKSVELFDYTHSLFAELDELMVEVGKRGIGYKVKKKKKLYSYLSLFPLKKKHKLGLYIYIDNFPDDLDKEKFLEQLEELTGKKRQEILTQKSVRFNIDTKE
ncbi:MAG: hypothetical protein ACOC53_01490, partial [Candidatus Saliniplasma sp.]